MVNVHIADGDELARVGTRWVRTVLERLTPEVWKRLLDAAPLLPAPVEWDSPYGPPGGVFASALVFGRPWRGTANKRAFSDGIWEWLSDQLVGQPIDASITLHQLDSEGRLDNVDDIDRGVGSLTVSVRCDEDDPTRVQLSLYSSLTGPGTDPHDAQNSRRWADTVYILTADLDVSYGQICDDSTTKTSLESAMVGPNRIRYLRSQGQVLPGYSWATICPPDLTRRLGGIEQLAESGAFAHVRPLARGGVFLQATECFADYDEAAVRRVFLALAPVLPTGTAKPEQMEEYTQRLVWEDAAWYADPTARPPAPQLPSGTELGAASSDPGAGHVVVVENGYEIRFDRRFSVDAAAVWRLLTDPAAVVGWYGWQVPGVPTPRCVIEPAAGGRIVLPYPYPTKTRGPRIMRNTLLGTITTAEIPTRLAYDAPGPDGPDSRVTWQLTPNPQGGCRVSLTYLTQFQDHLPRLLADWHTRLDALTELATGGDPEPSWQRWKPLHDHYTADLA